MFVGIDSVSGAADVAKARPLGIERVLNQEVESLTPTTGSASLQQIHRRDLAVGLSYRNLNCSESVANRATSLGDFGCSRGCGSATSVTRVG